MTEKIEAQYNYYLDEDDKDYEDYFDYYLDEYDEDYKDYKDREGQFLDTCKNFIFSLRGFDEVTKKKILHYGASFERAEENISYFRMIFEPLLKDIPLPDQACLLLGVIAYCYFADHYTKDGSLSLSVFIRQLHEDAQKVVFLKGSKKSVILISKICFSDFIRLLRCESVLDIAKLLLRLRKLKHIKSKTQYKINYAKLLAQCFYILEDGKDIQPVKCKWALQFYDNGKYTDKTD